MKRFKYKKIALITALAIAVAGCGKGDPMDGFTVHGLGEAETSVISGENRPGASNNTVEAEFGLNVGKEQTSSVQVTETKQEKPTPPTTSPTTTAPTTTEPEVTVVTEAECAYKILHSGNYSTEYYTYTESGNVLEVHCSFCNKELGSIDLISMIQQQFEATNRERTAAGLQELRFNAGGAVVAAKRARELVTDFSHDRFEQMTAEEYTAIGFVNTCGENICMFGLNPDSMNAGEYANTLWMNSPGHRENILNGAYTSVAISVYFDPDTRCLYWVQLFGG